MAAAHVRQARPEGQPEQLESTPGTSNQSACALVLFGILSCTGAQAHYFSINSPSTAGAVLGNACQRYALAVALAWQRDPAFPLGQSEQILQAQAGLEQAAQQARYARAIGSLSAPDARAISHGDLAAAIASYTRGAYALRSVDVHPNDLWKTLVARLASSRSIDDRIQPLGVNVATPVLLSARRAEGASYSFGHLIPVFSTRAGGNPQLLVLRAKTRFARDIRSGGEAANGRDVECTPDAADPTLFDSDYVVRLMWMPSSAFDWHRYGDRVRVFWLERSVVRAR